MAFIFILYRGKSIYMEITLDYTGICVKDNLLLIEHCSWDEENLDIVHKILQKVAIG